MPDRIPLIPVTPAARPDPPGRDGGRPSPEAPRWEDVVQRMRAYAAARGRAAGTAAVVEASCEFCGVEIDAEQHGHLVDVPRRALLCVCRPCYLLFTHDGAGRIRSGSGARFRAVTDRYLRVSDEALEPGILDALQLPTGLAFFFTNSDTGRTTAFYPSPAGATESELSLDAWTGIVSAIPQLRDLAPDVEGLLVRRTELRADALIVPIDACYELVGRIRRNWRGFHGGDDVWRDIDDFFARATERAMAAAR